MRLRDLFSDDADDRSASGEPWPRCIEVAGLAVDSRAVKPGDVFFALAGSKTDGARFIDAAIAAGAVAVVGEHPPDGRARSVCRSTPNPRRALALAAAKFYPRQPANHRRGHRHQRQDLGRGLHAADLAAARPCLRQHRHHRPGVAEAHRLRLADHARSDRAASPARRDRGRRRHASRAWKPPRTGSISIGSTACASRAGGFTNLSRDHMDYHPDCRALSRRKAAAVPRSGRAGGAAVISADHDCSAEVIDAARARKLRVITVGRKATARARAFAWSSGDRRLCAEARRSNTRAQARDPAAAGRRIPDRERAGLGRPRDRHRRRRRCGVRARSNISKAPRAGSNWSASATARRSSSITRTSRMRWRRRCRRCGPMPSASSSWCSAPAATATPGKRPMMGAIAAENADSVIVTDDNPRSENPAAIRAAILAAAKGAQRDRRPRRGDPRRDRGVAAGRRAADRRQGPRDRTDRRRQDAAVQRSRGGGGGAGIEGAHERDTAVDVGGDGAGDARRRAAARCRRRSPGFPSTAAPSRRARPISRSRATSMTAMISSMRR